MGTELPNILLIQADQLQAQVLGCYGGNAQTPRIDALAASGAVFDNAYCNFPLCAPSRFSMLSGMLPSRIGAYDNGAEFPAQIPTFAHYLRLAGYRTCLSGKQHFVGPDMLHGFHERLTPELYPTDFAWTPSWTKPRMESNNDSSGVTRAGVCVRSVQMDHDEAALYGAKTQLHNFARDRSKPFLMVASFTHPHEPYYCQQQHWDRYRHDDIEMPSIGLRPADERLAHTQRMLEHHGLLDPALTPEHVRIARHAYLANVSYVDEMVGALMDTLADTGLADNTIVVITSDHGDMLGEHGMWFKKHFFDACLRVPLIICAPNHFASSRQAQNVSLVDLLPTLTEFAGLDANAHAPEALDGESLVGVCAGNTARDDATVFAEITSEGVSAPMFMVKRGDFKLLTGGGVPNALFNLASDAHEITDLAAVANMRPVRDQLAAIAAQRWDSEALTKSVIASQGRRRLVDTAHRDGQRVNWGIAPSEPLAPWLLRGEGLYNDWAWKGIDE
jgi:choline-sulfatase